ncbi:MAG: chemotaxis protein CheW [Pseudomonadota bacterium]
MDDLLSEFLTETFESLDVVDVELVTLEKEPNNKEVLSKIFRLVHTIKGTCGFLGLPRLEAVAHASETVLGKFRDGELPVTPEAVSLILKSLDQIKELLFHLEANEVEAEGDDAALIGELERAAVGDYAAAGASESEVSGADGRPSGVEAAATPPDDGAVAAPEATTDLSAADAAATEAALGRALKPGEVSLDELEAAFAAAAGPDAGAASDPAAAGSDEESASLAQAAPAPDPKPATAPAQKPAAKAPSKPAAETEKKSAQGGGIANQSIRVNVDVLEDLMTMVSELVLTRNQLLQMVRNQEDSEFKVPLQRLSNVTSDLQEAVMKTRMQPIGNAWQKLPRIVRDLSLELDKKIELKMSGADTELDRQVLELIKDPLTHMVRNSADHGLEMPDVRVAAGKPALGTINLKAYHEGGHILIEVADDGAGLNTDKIKKKAVERGLVSEADADDLTENQIAKFIFHAGFSTAKVVTNVSGRGVGMDVVRTNIETIGGTVDVRSSQGQGSTFIIKIPLTLAIVSALIVETANQRYAMPQLNVVELVRTSGNSDYRIEQVNAAPVLRLRDRLLPLVELAELLGIETEARESDREEAFVIVSHVGSQVFGIIVDGVFDTEEIVVKPSASMLRDINMFSGNTILGDGSVIMIIDPNGVAAAVSRDMSENKMDAFGAVDSEADKPDTQSMLIFRAGSEDPKAVPLSVVTRLEEIAIEKIEQANGMDVVQYRGRLMPIMPISSAQQLAASGRQAVLVFTEGENNVGLAVDEIVDIVQDMVNLELNAEVPGTLGTAVIKGKATELLDVAYFLERGFADWFRHEGDAADLGRRLLLVDDSPFFLNIVAPLLRESGYDVVTAENGVEALDHLQADDAFDMIISDIEMPEMDGMALARAVRTQSSMEDLPLIALSSRSTAQDVSQAIEAGFTCHVAKFDRDRLVGVIEQTLNQQEAVA